MTDNAITDVKARIFEAAGGEKNFRRELPFIFRQAVDELLDAPRTRRLRLSELEPNEKAILGIKVEAALRYLLDFPRGLLDFQIGPHPVDVKFSIKTSWMIPPEAIGHICILISADEVRSRFSIGLARATEENLNKGRNRDGKTSFSAAGKVRIDWIAHDEAYPPNLWESVSPDLAQSIFEPPSGTMRLVRLLEVMEGQPVHRSTIHAVARQHDYMKRLRANQGARDHLHPKGVVILSGSQDGPLLRKLGIALGADFIMAWRPRNLDEAALITKKPRHAKNFQM
jgi:hypothetical protein